MSKENKLRLSTLGHTWIFDIDGTIVRHNGYKDAGKDTFLPGAKEFLLNISDKDMIILLTSRTEEYRQEIEAFLQKNNIRYNHLLCGAPPGERILINDDKPSGLPMSFGIRTIRDCWANISIEEDPSL